MHAISTKPDLRDTGKSFDNALTSKNIFNVKMRPRTKRRLKFYLTLVGIVALSLSIGIVFQYVAFMAWQSRFGLLEVKYEIFLTMAAVLFVMCIADIYLFFRLITKRE